MWKTPGGIPVFLIAYCIENGLLYETYQILGPAILILPGFHSRTAENPSADFSADGRIQSLRKWMVDWSPAFTISIKAVAAALGDTSFSVHISSERGGI